MAFQPMTHTVTGHGTSSWDPFQALSKGIGEGIKARNRYQAFKDAHDAARNEEHEQETPDTVQQQTTPTPANTGAPVPGYRQRGSNITPESTGAPVPGTLKQPATTGTITPKHTRAYPKQTKQTAPGTRPKKK